MTKKQAVKLFNEIYKNELDNDLIAKKTAWNDFTDRLMKDGEITENQCYNWTSPF